MTPRLRAWRAVCVLAAAPLALQAVQAAPHLAMAGAARPAEGREPVVVRESLAGSGPGEGRERPGRSPSPVATPDPSPERVPAPETSPGGPGSVTAVDPGGSSAPSSVPPATGSPDPSPTRSYGPVITPPPTPTESLTPDAAVPPSLPAGSASPGLAVSPLPQAEHRHDRPYGPGAVDDPELADDPSSGATRGATSSPVRTTSAPVDRTLSLLPLGGGLVLIGLGLGFLALRLRRA